MVDSSVIYNVVVNFQQKNGEKAAKITEAVNKQTIKMGKIFTGLNNLFRHSAIRLFSLLFVMRRMRDAVVGLLAPAAQMLGLQEIWNMTLGLFFLPVMMALLPYLFQFADWLIGLPEPIKIAVGIFVLLGAAILTLGTYVLTLVVLLAALGGGSVVAGATMAASFAPVALAIGGIIPLLSALVLTLTSGFSTGTKVALSLLEVFTYMAIFMRGPLLAGATAVLRFFGLLGTVGLGSIVALVGGILSVVAVLFLLKDKFGSFGNALKAWVAAIALAVAAVVQFVVNGILTLIQQPLKAISKIISMAANLASSLGFSGTAKTLNRLASGLTNFGNFQTNLMTPTAQFLDQHGFNPEAVSGLSSASPTAALSSQGVTGANPTATVIQNNTFNVADWQQYQVKMAAQQRQMEADLKRQLAAGQA